MRGGRTSTGFLVSVCQLFLNDVVGEFSPMIKCFLPYMIPHIHNLFFAFNQIVNKDEEGKGGRMVPSLATLIGRKTPSQSVGAIFTPRV